MKTLTSIDLEVRSLRPFALFVAVIVSNLLGRAGIAQDAQPPAREARDKVTRHAVVICGLPGDAEHRKLYAESVELLYRGLTAFLSFETSHVHVLWGDSLQPTDGVAVRASLGVTSRELLTDSVVKLRNSIQANDVLWVFVLGHAHYDGRYNWLNIRGPDINDVEFGRLWEGLECDEQLFMIGTAASGFYFKSLAAPNRVVICATAPDLEVNETLFAHRFVRAISEPPEYRDFDLDRDGVPTLLDAYLWSTRAVAEDFTSAKLLATEHAQLDDNGDGRGTELQLDYLPEELGGRMKPGDTVSPPSGDGKLARTIFLAHPPSPPVAEEPNVMPTESRP